MTTSPNYSPGLTYTPYESKKKRLSAAFEAPHAPSRTQSSQILVTALQDRESLTRSHSAGPYSKLRAATPPASAANAGFPFSAANTPVSTPRPRSVLQPAANIRNPYKPGFQPKGVTRSLTEEFVAKRKSKGESKKLEEARLLRRLDKLIDLHFPSTPAKSNMPPRTSSTLSISSLSEETWTKLLTKLTPTDLKSSEQSIVKWQEDSLAKHCPLCRASFGLKARKHHCRTCGRVVCFLPAFAPRQTRCSTFVTYVRKSEKTKGVIVELELEEDIPPPSNAQLMNPTISRQLEALRKTREAERKTAIRMCRDCLTIVQRKQDQDRPPHLPNYLTLYSNLQTLQSEITTGVPSLRSLLSPTPPHPTPHRKQTLTARQNLLATMASYDALSRQIRDLPAKPGGSQDLFQKSIYSRAQLFLGEQSAVLKTLKGWEEGKRSVEKGGGEVGKRLEVLMEQEGLVRGYLEDAQGRRQFEDAQSLKISLDELRKEILALQS